jgi:hypothetical protein
MQVATPISARNPVEHDLVVSAEQWPPGSNAQISSARKGNDCHNEARNDPTPIFFRRRAARRHALWTQCLRILTLRRPGDGRCRRFGYAVHFGDELVASSGYRSNVTRLSGVIAQGLSQLSRRDPHPAIKVRKLRLVPEARPQIVLTNDLARAFKQSNQHAEWQLLDRHPLTIFEQDTGAGLYLKWAEPVAGCLIRRGLIAHFLLNDTETCCGLDNRRILRRKQ